MDGSFGLSLSAVPSSGENRPGCASHEGPGPARAFDLEGRRAFIADGPGGSRAATGFVRNESQGRGLTQTDS